MDLEHGESPSEGSALHLRADAADNAQVNVAGRDQYIAERDLHVHYSDGVRRAAGPVVEECPYPGLAAFEPQNAELFFGRDREIAELTGRLAERAAEGGMLVLVGPSGAGKSSLLRAGLLPLLDRAVLPAPGSRHWPRILLTPTSRPLAELASQLAPLTGGEPDDRAAQWLADPEACVAAVRRALATHSDSPARIVLVVDQFEEVFTLCPSEEERRAFIELVSRLARPDDGGQPVGLVVAGLRSDWYSRCLDYPQLRSALRHDQLLLGPMSVAQLREAIQCPARDVGLDIEPGLVELLLRDLGVAGADRPDSQPATGYEAGRLPLLAHALRATWQQRHGHTLTVDGYRATGGIEHAVRATAERVFRRIQDHGWEQLTRALLLRLVVVGEHSEDTRRRVLHGDLLESGTDPEAARSILEAFVAARLLTREHDTVAITHEALLRAWPRLREWISSDRAGNLVRQDLEAAAAAWRDDPKDASRLYRGERLKAARILATSRPDGVSPTASAFLAASARYDRRAAGLRRGAVVLVSVLALIASVTAVYAGQQGRRALQQRNQAIASRIGLQADRLRRTEPALAAQLDVESYRLDPSALAAYAGLLADANTPLPTDLSAPYSSTLAYSRDGSTLVAAGTRFLDLPAIQAWSLGDPGHPVSPGGPRLLPEPVSGAVGSYLAISPDGRTLMESRGGVAGTASTIRLWSLADPGRPTPLGTPVGVSQGPMSAAVFSPDGRILATDVGMSGNDDNVIQLWNVSDPAHLTRLEHPLVELIGPIAGMAFSPDGRTLAIARGSRYSTTAGGLELWDVSDPDLPSELDQSLTGTDEVVLLAAFSPDGRTLAAVTGTTANLTNTTVELWNLSDPRAPRRLPPLTVSTGQAYRVAFSPDSRILAVASTGATNGRDIGPPGAAGVQLWNVSDPAAPAPLGKPLAGVGFDLSAMVFSPLGTTLAVASAGNVQVWSLPATPLVPANPDVGASATRSAAFSPDGRILATVDEARGGSPSGTMQLWDMADPAHPAPLSQPLTSHSGDLGKAAFRPDGRIIAAYGASDTDSSVRLWDVSDPAHPSLLPVPLTGPGGSVLAEAFSPGREQRVLAIAVAVGGATNNPSRTDIQLWNVTDPGHPSRLALPLTEPAANWGSLAFSPDGESLAIGLHESGASVDTTVWLWNVNSGHPPVALSGSVFEVSEVQFSPSGRTLAAVGASVVGAHGDAISGGVELWDLSRPGPAAWHGDFVDLDMSLADVDKADSLAFSPDSSSFAVVRSNTEGGFSGIQLWKLTGATHPTPLGDPIGITTSGTVVSVAFSPRENLLVSSAGDGATRIWQLNPDQDTRRICAITGSALTAELWHRYLPELPYDPPCR